jgi:cytochrome c oxidase subunit 5a
MHARRILSKRFFLSEHRVNPTEFEQKWIKFFEHECEDTFEVQRGLNNCFSIDIVPQATVLEAALHACRRHNTFATASRIFWALRSKVENESQYNAYVKYLQPTMDELGVLTSFQLGRNETM